MLLGNFIRERKFDFAFIIIISFGILIRVYVAMSQGWLADELFHIRFINEWFLDNFSDYFFQWNHDNYPPRSPHFGNPPLALWFMTFGMWIGAKFGISYLLASRLVDIVFFGLLAIVLYRLSKRFFNEWTAIFSVLFLSISPMFISINSSAYLDTVLSFFIMAGIFFFFLYIDNQHRWQLYTMSLILGLALLTKLYTLYILVPIFAYLGFLYFKKKLRFNQFVIAGILVLLVPIVLWAGARDVTHVNETFSFINRLHTTDEPEIGMFADYADVENAFAVSYLYYPSLLLGRLTSIELIILFISFIFLVFICFKLFSRKYVTQDERKFLWLFVFILAGLAFTSLKGGLRSTTHTIAFVIPFICLVSGYTISQIFKVFNDDKKMIIMITGIVGLSVLLPLFTWPPQFFNVYNNELLGSYFSEHEAYRIGDGEGLEGIFTVLQNETRGALIGVVRFGYLAKEYTDEEIFFFPTNEGVEYAFSQGVDMIVIHKSHFSGGIKPRILLELEAEGIQPDYVFTIKNKPQIFVFKLDPNMFYRPSDPITFEELSKWWLNKRSINSTIDMNIKSSSLTFQYAVKSKDWVFAQNKISKADSYEGVKFSVEPLNSETGAIYFDLLTNDSYLRWRHALDFNASNEYYVPYESMSERNGAVNISQISYLKFSFDSTNDSNNVVKVSNLTFIQKIPKGEHPITTKKIELENIRLLTNTLSWLILSLGIILIITILFLITPFMSTRMKILHKKSTPNVAVHPYTETIKKLYLKGKMNHAETEEYLLHSYSRKETHMIMKDWRHQKDILTQDEKTKNQNQ